ncbi:MAG: HNH endonuclease [Pirellulaceae bacterium]|nr:HNH endonuclease [Pirellulaceae bacterium]
MLLPGPGDFIRSGLEALVRAYVVNLEWDVKWALDMSLPDSWGSRLDNDWVYAALGAGLYSTFDVQIPLGTFNPLERFSAGDYATASLRSRPSNNNRFNATRIGVPGGFAGFSSMVQRTTKKGVTHNINIYHHPKFGNVAMFPDAAIRHQVKINPTGKSSSDIAAANEKMGKPAGHRWEELGEPHTWHHDTRRGIMQLVPSSIHSVSEGGVPHVGGAKLWYLLG